MCGFAAIVGAKGANGSERAQKAIGILRHRGPDGVGCWQSRDGSVSIAHARLSIIDLVSGGQPISNEDETVVCAVNGEFYGFARIRAELEGFGHRFKTQTDSEILVHLYERYGGACLERLHGEFAFVLWDERERVLFAGRDRFGVKPLYYAECGGEVVIASEVKSLQQAGVTLEWDEEGLREKLLFQTSFGGRTLFRGVRELPAGHYLLVKSGACSVRQYWDLCYPLQEELPAQQSDDYYADTLKELLEEAVRCRLRADVPLACYLSGGIDSNSVLGLMARHTTQAIQAFCLSFDDPAFDEFGLAAESAERFGAALTRVPVCDADLAADFRETVWHCETLIENANAMARFSLSRAVNRAGFRVVLTGDGADEVFAGYRIFAADSLRYGSSFELHELKVRLGLGEQQLQQLMFPEGRTAPAHFLARLGYIPAWLEGRCRSLDLFSSLFQDGLGAFDLYERLLDAVDVRGRLNGRSILNRSLYLHAKTSLPGATLSCFGDRVEMAHSVESRLPFLDHRVVDFARGLSDSQKIRKGAEKFVLRRAMRGVVAPELCGRRKRPLATPSSLADEHSQLGGLLQDLLRSRALERVPFFCGKRVRALLDRLPALDVRERRELESPFLALASACVLAEEFSL